MVRPKSRVLALAALAAALTAAGCGSNNNTNPNNPSNPTQITESFSDTLNVNGARVHTFTVTTTGTVTATLTALAPDAAATVGLNLGTWNATQGQCQLTIVKTDATQGTSIVGSASVGVFCVYLQDTGKLTQASDYTVTVLHF